MPVDEHIECWNCGKAYVAKDHGNCPQCCEHWLDEPDIDPLEELNDPFYNNFDEEDDD
jgi:hypothetical protein